MSNSKRQISSNVVGLSYAREKELGVLHSTTATPPDAIDPTWYELEPNGYNDFGVEIETVARDPINSSRQNKKGVVVDANADGGFTHDLQQRNLQRLMQGFMFADMRELGTTLRVSDGVNTAYTVTATGLATTGDFTTRFSVGDIVKGNRHTNVANDAVGVVTAVTAGVLTLNTTDLVAEAPPAYANYEVVGKETTDDQLGLTVGVADYRLEADAAFDLTSLGLNVGQWIGVDFGEGNRGFAKIQSISAATIVLKEPTWQSAASLPRSGDPAGTGAKVSLWYGPVIRNEKDLSKIICRSWQIERTLGNDENGVQSEYLIGAIANEFNMSLETASKIETEMNFVALDAEYRNGNEGLKNGTRIPVLIEDVFNTTSNVVQIRLFVHDDSLAQANSLFGYVNEAAINVTNGAEGLKAIGVFGSFDVKTENFTVSGDLDVYFSTVAAVQAVRNNADVAMNVIMAKDNAGMVFDIPLLSLGGGRVNVEKDEPIMLPLSHSAAENQDGYTMMISYFNYLPDYFMPQV